jgi:hypothetical protein
MRQQNLTCNGCGESGPYEYTPGDQVRCEACGEVLIEGATPDPSSTATFHSGRQLVKRAPTAMTDRGVELRTMNDLARFSKTVASSRSYSNWTDEFKVAVAVQLGMELGMSPAQSLGSFYVVRGSAPQLYGHAALALLRSHPAIKAVSVGNSDDKWDADEHFGYCKMIRTDMPNELLEERFTVAEAKRARLWPDKANDSAWSKYSEDMLVHRAVARAARRHASDVLLGVAVVEPTIPARPDGPVEPEMKGHDPMQPGEVDPALAIIDAQEVGSGREREHGPEEQRIQRDSGDADAAAGAGSRSDDAAAEGAGQASDDPGDAG